MNWYFSAGDLNFFWQEQLRSLSWLPQVLRKDMGLGTSGLLSLWLDYPFRIVIKLLSVFGLSWFFIEKLLWLSVFLTGMYASYKLAKFILGKSPYVYLTPFIYVANTYFLLLFSGGQLGVAWAYAYAPIVLQKFIESFDLSKKINLRRIIINGLFLALLMILDLRIAYLVFGVVALYIFVIKKSRLVLSLIGSLFIAASIHLFWILPTVFASSGVSEKGEQFTNPGMLKFLSFADFSHALSLLHPNWPENLFGKVYFFQPEFLIIPILAFSAIFVRDQKVRFFALLAIIGAFFAKGVNDPAGAVFQWMFTYVPGFVMFRDPTKFYIYVAIAYSILIPAFFARINKTIVLIIFVLFWILTVRGIHVSIHNLPTEYVRLKDILVSDMNPSRTLWIPTNENFAYSSDIHPLIASSDIVSMQMLYNDGVRYVIVPEDSNKRIFLNNYTFDPQMRSDLIASLSATPLKRDERFKELAVFENNNFNMQTTIPVNVAKQQKLANIGTAVSLVFLVGWVIAIKFL